MGLPLEVDVPSHDMFNQSYRFTYQNCNSRNSNTGQEYDLDGQQIPANLHIYRSIFIPCNDDFYEHYSGSSPYRVHMLDQLHNP